MSDTLEELHISYERFIDKVTVLYGESGTGKSSIIVDILHSLKDHIEQIIVISPTDPQNGTYGKGLVPTPFIHYVINETLLADIWDRQEALVSIWAKANSPKIIMQLFNRIPNIGHVKAALAEIMRKFTEYKTSMQESDDPAHIVNHKIALEEEKCHTLLRAICKKAICVHSAKLLKLRLSEQEEFCLKYINLNPKLVLIFDDCTEQLKKFKANPTLQKIFYQGRHVQITCIIACHTDKALDPELKKNARVSIFTEPGSARAYFDRPSHNFDKSQKIMAHRLIGSTFTNVKPYQKIVWVRDERSLYSLTADKRPGFKFGSPIIREYAKKIEAGKKSSLGNKFAGTFT